jgi:colicin import membrane protein
MAGLQEYSKAFRSAFKECASFSTKMAETLKGLPQVKLPKKRKAGKKQPREGPKKPMTAYLYYSRSDDGQAFLKNDQNGETYKLRQKALGEQWKGLPAEEKEPYEISAKEAKAKYDEEKKQYDEDHPKGDVPASPKEDGEADGDNSPAPAADEDSDDEGKAAREKAEKDKEAAAKAKKAKEDKAKKDKAAKEKEQKAKAAVASPKVAAAPKQKPKDETKKPADKQPAGADAASKKRKTEEVADSQSKKNKKPKTDKPAKVEHADSP